MCLSLRFVFTLTNDEGHRTCGVSLGSERKTRKTLVGGCQGDIILSKIAETILIRNPTPVNFWPGEITKFSRKLAKNWQKWSWRAKIMMAMLYQVSLRDVYKKRQDRRR